MPTTVIKTIDPDGGGDYLTLDDWYQDRKGDLVASDTIEVAYCRTLGTEATSHIKDGVFIDATENTVDADHYFQIMGEPGHDHAGVFGRTKAYLSLQTPLEITTSFTRIGPGICIYPDLDVGNPQAIYVHGSADLVVMDRIIAHHYGNSNPTIQYDATGASGGVLKSSIVVNATGSTTLVRADGAGVKLAVYNNTLIGDNVTLRAMNGAEITEDNNYLCAFGGTQYHTFTGAGVINKGANTCTDDASALTVGNRNVPRTNVNFQLINTGGAGWHEGQTGIADWHLTAGSALRGKGVDLSAITPAAFRPTSDIDGSVRVAWDGGAAEYKVPTTVISTVGAGKDYATFADWVSARKGNLAHRGTAEVAVLYGTVGPIELLEEDWGTTIQNTVQLKAGEPHSGVFSTGLSYVKAAASGGKAAIRCGVGGVTLGPGLVVDADGSGLTNEVAVELFGEHPARIVLDELIIRSRQATSPFLIYGNGLINYSKQFDAILANYVRNPALVRSCIAYAPDSSGAVAINGVSGAWDIFGNTLAVNGNSAKGISIAAWGGISLEDNNYVRANTVYDATGLVPGTHTATANTEAATVGLRSIAYSTANFVNVTAGSEDLHIVEGASALRGAADFTGLPVTRDVDGQLRSSVGATIGGDQYAIIVSASDGALAADATGAAVIRTLNVTDGVSLGDAPGTSFSVACYDGVEFGDGAGISSRVQSTMRATAAASRPDISAEASSP